jgi:Xaa-Pro dipeptidase
MAIAHSVRYFNEYGLENVYLPSPEHSKYINQDVLKRYIPVGGVRIEDDILVGLTSSGE